MKRKTLLNNLKKDYSDEIIRSSLIETGVRADIRAEALRLETMTQIFRQLKN
jgi:16S rRNA A1518/A1519 N6-dimethyltransferase RsmA/KsgA/DIM1 with predicted DNA glycosylase/AP lyase activity